MALRKFRTRVVGKTDRQPIWIGVNLSGSVVVTGNVLLGSFNTAALEARPFTIIRTRLIVHVESDQSAASEVTRGGFGITVVSDQAVAAGAASVPAPIANTDAPFFVYEAFINSFELGDATGFVQPSGTLLTVDSKAMRKVGINEDVAVVGQTAGAAGSIITVAGRMLVKLH